MINFWDCYVDHCDAEGVEPTADGFAEYEEERWEAEQERRYEQFHNVDREC